MRRLAKIVSALMVFSVTTLHADNPPAAGSDAPAPAPTSAPPAPAPAPPPVMPAKDMQDQSIKIMAQVASDSRHITALRDMARRQKDVIKLSCVNDKMVELKAQENIADAANRQLQTALEASSEDRQSAFDQLSRAGAAIKRLHEEARACVGEPEIFKQENGTQVTRPEIPDDPTINPVDVSIEVPGYSSPYN